MWEDNKCQITADVHDLGNGADFLLGICELQPGSTSNASTSGWKEQLQETLWLQLQYWGVNVKVGRCRTLNYQTNEQNYVEVNCQHKSYFLGLYLIGNDNVYVYCISTKHIYYWENRLLLPLQQWEISHRFAIAQPWLKIPLLAMDTRGSWGLFFNKRNYCKCDG